MNHSKFDLGRRRGVHDHSDFPLDVTTPSYQRFADWLDRQLETLVARWLHAAAPRALRRPRWRLRPRKPR